MLDGCRIECRADLGEERFALRPVVAEDAQLDELVGEEIHVDFVQYRRGEAMLADEDHRVEMMGLRPQRASFRSIERFHERKSTGAAPTREARPHD